MPFSNWSARRSDFNQVRTVARIKWTATTSNGSGITKYVIDISKGKEKTSLGSARKTIFKGLKPGRYKFRIAAVNARGTSPYSAWMRIRIH